MTGEKNLKEIVGRRAELFGKKPEAAVYKPKITSRHVRNLYTESTARGHLVKSDYGEAAGGDNQAPNPVELLLAAMASCLEAAFYEFAVHEGLMVSAVTVDAEGTLDLRGLFMIGDVPGGFKDIRFTFTIESSEDEARVRDLAQRIIDHCPVVDSLKKPTPISGQIVVRKG